MKRKSELLLLRRKRRQATRVIRKKNKTAISLQKPTALQEPKQGSKLWRVFLLIIVLGIVGYWLYEQDFTLSDQNTAEANNQTSSSPDNLLPARDPERAVTNQQRTPIEKKIQIEVLNGCGVKGIAKIFEVYLRDHNFDVVNTDNYREKGKVKWNVKHSFVVDQYGKPEQARQVADALGILEERVSSYENPSPICDVRFVIGKDFRELKGFKEIAH